MKGTYLGEFEELILLTVGILNDDAYGVAIKDEVDRQTGRKVRIGSIHSALQRLEEKGFLNSQMGGATAARGGRRKRLFTVTTAGKAAMVNSRDLRNNLWAQLPETFVETARS